MDFYGKVLQSVWDWVIRAYWNDTYLICVKALCVFKNGQLQSGSRTAAWVTWPLEIKNNGCLYVQTYKRQTRTAFFFVLFMFVTEHINPIIIIFKNSIRQCVRMLFFLCSFLYFLITSWCSGRKVPLELTPASRMLCAAWARTFQTNGRRRGSDNWWAVAPSRARCSREKKQQKDWIQSKPQIVRTFTRT